MGKTSRKSYTREFKLSLFRELESGKKLGQLSRENNIHPNMISRWKLEHDTDPEQPSRIMMTLIFLMILIEVMFHINFSFNNISNVSSRNSSGVTRFDPSPLLSELRDY